MGEDAGIMLVTQGYGPIAVIIPPIRAGQPPRVIYIDREYAFRLAELGLLKEFTTKIALGTLSLAKLDEVNIKVHELGIILPKDLQILLDRLSLALRTEEKFPLGVLEDIAKRREETFYLDVESIVTELKKYIKARKLLELIDEI